MIAVGVAVDDHGRHRDVLQQPGVGRPAERGGGGESADRDDEQARALRLPARRRGRRTVPAVGDHPVLGVQQHLDLRPAALRVRQDRKEEEAKKQEESHAGRPMHPAPGAKPKGARAEPTPNGDDSPDGSQDDVDEPASPATADADAQTGTELGSEELSAAQRQPRRTRRAGPAGRRSESVDQRFAPRPPMRTGDDAADLR